MTKRGIFDFLRGRGCTSNLVVSDSPSVELIEAHIERFVGSPETVIHEVASQYVHVDVHIVRPTAGRNFYTLVTSGMSDLPMKVPEGLERYQFAELMLCLPLDWPMLANYEVTGGEDQYWPMNGLRYLARMPHQYKTWLGWGHSIPNGDPPQPVAPDSSFCGFVLLDVKTVSEQFRTLVSPDGKQIRFWAAYPVYPEEMSLKLEQGASRLEELFAQFKVTELIDPNRVNVATGVQ